MMGSEYNDEYPVPSAAGDSNWIFVPRRRCFGIAPLTLLILATPSARATAGDFEGESPTRAQFANAPPEYLIFDLGTFGGLTGIAKGINDLGQACGGTDNTAGERVGFRWDDGELVPIGTLPGTTQSEAFDVNNLGQIVACAAVTNCDASFLWDNGARTDLDALLPGINGTLARAINDSTQIVGTSPPGGLGIFHAFLWENGVMRDLTVETGGVVTSASDINNLGQMTGSAKPQGTFVPHIYDGQDITFLPTLGGQAGGAAISDTGIVAGVSARTPGSTTFHAFLWQNGVITDLGALGGFSSSRAEDVNDAGQVVGSPYFLYDPVWGMLNLYDLLPPNHGWTDLIPNAINNHGQIAGQGYRDPGYGFRVVRPFLMSPVGVCVGLENTAGEAACNDYDDCTRDRCVDNACVHTPKVFGDLDEDGQVGISDVTCFLEGYAAVFERCTFSEADVHPCVGNGVLTLADVFYILDAIEGIDPCCGSAP